MATIAGQLFWDEAVKPLLRFCTSGDSYAMPAARRKLQAYGRGGMYFALKRLCMSPPLHEG